jgi:hypothetical protein
VLFWNLRANGVLVSWLSFAQFEKEIADIREWLTGDFGGSFYTFGSDIAFASSQDNQGRLVELFSTLSADEGPHWKWKMSSYQNLALYDYERPSLYRKHAPINQRDDRCSFLPEYPEQMFGTLALTIEWPSLMLPPRDVSAALVSGEKKPTWFPLMRSTESTVRDLELLRFRITSQRSARIQLSDDSPVEFCLPSLKQILLATLVPAGFSRLEEAHHAQYQRAFVERSGSLERACMFLVEPPYKEFFALMESNKKNSLGWLLKDPPSRRALHQADIFSALGANLPRTTAEYFDSGETLPREASELLALRLLERGFQLRCDFCSSLNWYIAEEVGQTFQCRRCYSEPRIKSNPMWLYKLPEVVFQLFNNDAEIALVAVNHLRKRAKHNFTYLFDSMVGSSKTERNIDFSCLADGRLFVGEAKSNDFVDDDQLNFYETLANQAAIDGLVFATSQKNWKTSTLQKIENLKPKFRGELILLTGLELYSNH